MHLYALLSLAALSSSLWWPSRPLVSLQNRYEPQPVHNAHHVFNAIHSSMRQWGSSLNHNGVSFFLATVPEGVLLHHGTGNSQRVEGMEWLAFEPEHAMNFAWKLCDNETLSFKEAIADHARSPAGWMHVIHREDDEQRIQVQGTAQSVTDRRPIPPPVRPPICVGAGYLHTYSTTRPLHLVYIDGQSAAKTTKGTLDSQDFILRSNGSVPKDPPPNFAFDDYRRAQDLCHLAKNDYKGQVDGYLRMEHGFEIILCDFSNLDVVSILGAQNDGNGNRFDPDDPFVGEAHFIFFSAVAARYNGIGGERVKITYDDFVTSFSYPDMDLWLQGEELPRLNGTRDGLKMRVKEDVRNLVLGGKFPGDGPHGRSPLGKHRPPMKHEILSAMSSEEARLSQMRNGRPPIPSKQEHRLSNGDKQHPQTLPPHHVPHPPVNWQSIADLYIARYANIYPTSPAGGSTQPSPSSTRSHGYTNLT